MRRVRRSTPLKHRSLAASAAVDRQSMKPAEMARGYAERTSHPPRWSRDAGSANSASASSSVARRIGARLRCDRCDSWLSWLSWLSWTSWTSWTSWASWPSRPSDACWPNEGCMRARSASHASSAQAVRGESIETNNERFAIAACTELESCPSTCRGADPNPGGNTESRPARGTAHASLSRLGPTCPPRPALMCVSCMRQRNRKAESFPPRSASQDGSQDGSQVAVALSAQTRHCVAAVRRRRPEDSIVRRLNLLGRLPPRPHRATPGASPETSPETSPKTSPETILSGGVMIRTSGPECAAPPLPS